jgi:hypothetical protein
MNQLTGTEFRLLESIYDGELQAVLRDIKDCNYSHLRAQFTKELSVKMDPVLGLPMPPPMRPWAQRQSQHYTIDEVWNDMCSKMEAMPALRSSNMDRLITKFQLASTIPAPNHQNDPNLGLQPLE